MDNYKIASMLISLQQVFSFAHKLEQQMFPSSYLKATDNIMFIISETTNFYLQ